MASARRGAPRAAIRRRRSPRTCGAARRCAEEETRLINRRRRSHEIARAIDAAGKVFVIGLGEDGMPARAFAVKLDAARHSR